jgi:hypothetical protein
MNRTAAFLLLALAACRSTPPPSDGPAPEKVQHSSGLAVKDWGDIEKFSGQFVLVEGKFDWIKGTHAMVTLDCELHVYLPHFDLFRRGDAWGEYVGKRVWVSGLLHTYTRDIPGYQGPSLELGEASGFGLLEK